jgi:hypothetical protein
VSAHPTLLLSLRIGVSLYPGSEPVRRWRGDHHRAVVDQAQLHVPARHCTITVDAPEGGLPADDQRVGARVESAVAADAPTPVALVVSRTFMGSAAGR